MTEPKRLTKIQVHQLFNVLGQIRDHFKNDPRRMFTITKLRNELNSEAVAVNEAMRPMDAFNALQKKRMALGNEYCERGPDNKPKIMPHGEFVIPDDKKAEFSEKLQTLMDENKAIITEQTQRSTTLHAFLNEPSDVVLSETLRIPVSCLPAGISGGQMEVLFPILIDDAQAAATAKT